MRKKRKGATKLRTQSKGGVGGGYGYGKKPKASTPTGGTPYSRARKR